MATATDGSAILDKDVSVVAKLDSVAGRAASAFAISRDQTQVLAGANGNTKAAILLDDSGSMSGTDPQRMRAQAAQLNRAGFGGGSQL